MRALFLLGRVIFGGFFAYNGMNHLLNARHMSQYAAAKGVKPAEAAVLESGALLLAGGLCVTAGLRPKQGLAAIIAFLLPVSFQMHRFWEETDPVARQNEMAHFAKNMALIGAALAMMQIEEPWPLSVDEAKSKHEEMFLHVGGHEFRSLPA